MEEQFIRLGIAAERIAATKRAEVPAYLLERISRPGHLWRVTPGDLACGLSHQQFWRILAVREYDEALVLEDDAVLDASFPRYLAPGLLARQRVGLIRLETRRQPVALGPPILDKSGLTLRELGSTHKGTAAYLVSRRVAENSLAHPLVNDMAVDRFLFGHGGAHLYRTRILQADPAPVVQLDCLDVSHAAAFSDISGPEHSRGAYKVTRHRAPLDVLNLEAPLALAKFKQRLRVPRLIGPRREVGFAADSQ